MTFRKRVYKVHVEAPESIRWLGTFGECGVCMAVDFGSLTIRAFLTPLADVTLHTVPYESLCDSLLCRSNPVMRQTVDLVENRSSPRNG
ncbi:hypothetical protein PoB_005384300 [Plakobranchus ocellatus]|uniref:Uncharacterized protein n=1 Tax=Plakobranchus ocellatus TaxID=259542 RepID=A0AAV4C651_9GAST|nr:hypothetical protein PoB_005384300 [Plakobranchus ocellatus]